MANPYQTVTTYMRNVARHFVARMKSNFPPIVVAGHTPSGKLALRGLTGCPNHRSDLQDGVGLRWAAV